MFAVTKTYRDLPAAHRQPGHDGHCRLIHGHDWRFDITFVCSKLDKNGFVIDLGELEMVKVFLVATFDHTLLLNQDDPWLTILCEALEGPEGFTHSSFAKIVPVPNCGMEGLAKLVFDRVNGALENFEYHKLYGRRVAEVTCWEDSKNRATYRP